MSATDAMPTPTDAAPAVDDAFLDVPLTGTRLIEASAGTGKTFTVATLVTRLVVERGLRLPQVLAVTFTEAATQELRARLRRRLALAAALADAIARGDAGAPVDGEAALTGAILRRRLAHEPLDALRLRLRRAEHEIDLAAVFTIHGFCARALAEHALLTGQPFDAPTLVGSERELHDEVAADLWRAFGSTAADAELLLRLWASPDQLAADLGALLAAPRLLPDADAAPDDPAATLGDAAAALRAAFAAHGDDACAALEQAVAGGVLHGGSYKATLPAQLQAALARWCAGDDAAAAIDDRIERLTPATLLLRTNKKHAGRTPASPLFDAVATVLDAQAARARWLAARSVELLHRLRDEAAQRLAELKRVRRVQGFDDLITGVADALDGPHGDALAAALRAQYAVALVDEFQDTDARQWSIFRRVFGTPGTVDAGVAAADRNGGTAGAGDAGEPPFAPDFDAAMADVGSDEVDEVDEAAGRADAGPPAPALFVIGDPKQAIYGFRGGDVHTYLAARACAVAAPPLAHNFRSRPAVLRAIAALYAAAGEAAFVDERIRFQPVAAGARRRDADFLRGGAAAPALTVHVVPAAGDKSHSADASRALATRACVAAIHGVLADARAGTATLHGRPVQPGDIAVLVRSHAEAGRMQAALGAVGIAAVAAGKQSLFASAEALELLALLEALLQPADDGRLRAALATVLLGVDAAGIDRLDRDDGWRRDWQLRALQWRERWQRHGPLALVSDRCAEHAPRLLALLDGERRLTNFLQLAELLQEADARALGLHGLVDWLRGRIAGADPNDEAQLLRLESDARRVQILTLHKSKGLEFPLVYLPYAGIGRAPKKPERHCRPPGDAAGALQWKVGKDDASERWQAAEAAHLREQRAEDARLLYVGLTRARDALWLATGALYAAADSPLAPMLRDRDALRAHPDVVIDDAPAGAAPARLSPPPGGAVPPPRDAARALPRDWWVYSFTQLSRDDAGSASASAATDAERGAADEPRVDPLADGAGDLDAVVAAEQAPFDPRFSGSRFGNVLHDALEHVDFAAWRDWRGGAAPASQEAPLRRALRDGGYAGDDVDDGLATLVPLVGHTLAVALPDGERLCDLPPDARRAEMEFHFALQPTAVDALLALLHAHGVVRERQAFGLRRRLEGLMTGKIDLTYTAGGRWYVLDYKSNRLPAYDAAALQRAMADSEYDLQALVYTLALHRWLRFRLGEAYDYARDFGGVRYLFCRGLDAARDDGRGVHAHRPGPALVDALDALFAGRAAGAAA